MTPGFIGAARLIDPREAGGGGPRIARFGRDDDGLVATLMPSGVAGVVIEDARCGADVQRFGAALAVFEARAGIDDGTLTIVATISSGAGLLALGSFAGCSARLRGIAWDGEAIARDIGARSPRTEAGGWIGPCATARSLVLAAASAACVEAIDAPFADAGEAAFRREAEDAAHDGFRRKIALTQAQAAIAAKIFG